MKPEWIFFDIGGTLTDESKFTIWRTKNNLRIAQKFEPSLSEADVLKVWEKASAINGNLDENILSLLIADKDDLQLAIEEVKKSKELAPSYTEQQSVRLESQEVVATLSQRYKLGIIANQSEGITNKLEEAGILKYLTNSKVSGHHGLTKPNPAYFEAVFKDTGANPSTSVMVDDNIERSLIPAKELGMATVWYKLQEREIPKSGIDYTITNLKDLLKLF